MFIYSCPKCTIVSDDVCHGNDVMGTVTYNEIGVTSQK